MRRISPHGRLSTEESVDGRNVVLENRDCGSATASFSNARDPTRRCGANVVVPVLSHPKAMRTAHDSPLPGDLIIREQEDRTGVRPLSVFVVAVWPQPDLSAGPYLSYGYALRQARQLALQRRVHVWHEHASGLQNVTED